MLSSVWLANSGQLKNVWLAANWDRKVKKKDVLKTDLVKTCDSLMKEKEPMALRLSGTLLLGVSRIYNKQVKYLHEDAHAALSKVRNAKRKKAVDLPPERATAAAAAIDLHDNAMVLEEDMHDELGLADLDMLAREDPLGLTEAGAHVAREQDLVLRESMSQSSLDLGDQSQHLAEDVLGDDLLALQSDARAVAADLGIEDLMMGHDAFADMSDPGVARDATAQGGETTMALQVDDTALHKDDHTADIDLPEIDMPDIQGDMHLQAAPMEVDMPEIDMPEIDDGALVPATPAAETEEERARRLNALPPGVLPDHQLLTQQDTQQERRKRRRLERLQKKTQIADEQFRQQLGDVTDIVGRQRIDLTVDQAEAQMTLDERLARPPPLLSDGMAPELLQMFSDIVGQRLKLNDLVQQSAEQQEREQAELPEIDMPDIDMPEVDLEQPNVDMPEIDMPEIDLPEIDMPEEGPLQVDAGLGLSANAIAGDDLDGTAMTLADMTRFELTDAALAEEQQNDEALFRESTLAETKRSRRAGWSQRTEGMFQFMRRQEGQQMHYFDLVKGQSRRTAVGVFYELLVLQNNGFVALAQQEPYSDIEVAKTERFHDAADEMLDGE
ncbi:MAG: hypothetical protein MHM6MM_005243 [Cercozoa sp. M6MM]